MIRSMIREVTYPCEKEGCKELTPPILSVINFTGDERGGVKRTQEPVVEQDLRCYRHKPLRGGMKNGN